MRPLAVRRQKEISIYMHKSIILFCLFFLSLSVWSCKKKSPPIETNKESNTAVSSRVLPVEEELIDEAQRLELPHIFCLSKTKLGDSIYVQIDSNRNGIIDTNEIIRSTIRIGCKYDVMTTPIPGVAGDRIDVFRHFQTPHDTLTISEADSSILTIGLMGSWFNRIVGDYLVVLLTTGPGPEGIWIYDIVNKKRTCDLSTEGRSWDGYMLTFWQPIDSVVTSVKLTKEVEEWKSSGNSVCYQELCTVDIRTGLLRRLRKFRCVPET
jgi:hypothetical protein